MLPKSCSSPIIGWICLTRVVSPYSPKMEIWLFLCVIVKILKCMLTGNGSCHLCTNRQGLRNN